jgi:acyl carrier protein
MTQNKTFTMEQLSNLIAQQIAQLIHLDMTADHEKLLNSPIADLIKDSLDLLDLGLQIEDLTGIEVKQEQLDNRVNAKQLAELLLS